MNPFRKIALNCIAVGAMSVMLLGAAAFAAETELAVGVGVTTGAELNIRDGASVDAGVVATLDKGLTVAILDNSIEGWYKISYEGKSGYVSADYLAPDEDGLFECYGQINGRLVRVRSAATTESTPLKILNKRTVVGVRGLTDGWYRVVTRDGTAGYIRSDLVELSASDLSVPAVTDAAADAETNPDTEPSADAAAIVATAKKYLGTRYAYGGASPKGFDCSGFTMYVYGQHGIRLPHSATSQWQSGLGTRSYSVSALQPGDLVFFNDPSRNAGKACSHAGIYIGNHSFIHSSTSKGVIVSSLASGYYATYFVGGMRI